ncbi:norsolorinic acid reductase [Seiridium cupressi]
MQKRGIRDQIVIATKFTINFHVGKGDEEIILGISDTPAWVVSKANEYACCNGLRQFSVYQGRWSAASRDFEREIIPMGRAEGMGLVPWGALGGGKFKTEEQRHKGDQTRAVNASEADIKVSKALETIAKRKNTIITSVAQAYVPSKAPYVFPVIGGRNVEHLKENIGALQLRLSEKDIKEIKDSTPFDLGFPSNFLRRKAPRQPEKGVVLEHGRYS